MTENINIMCVDVGINTSSVGFYEVELQKDEVGTIRLNDFVKDLWIDCNSKDIADLIINSYYSSECTMVMIDDHGFGKSVIDQLEKYNFPVFKASLNTGIVNKGIRKLRDYIQDNNFIVGKRTNIKLSNFNCAIKANGSLLDVKEQKEEFNNIIQFFSCVDECIFKDKNKNISTIECKLRDVVEILVKELNSVDVSNVNEIGELVRLIDKVNYIRSKIK